jgi:hypothetical protein
MVTQIYSTNNNTSSLSPTSNNNLGINNHHNINNHLNSSLSSSLASKFHSTEGKIFNFFELFYIF